MAKQLHHSRSDILCQKTKKRWWMVWQRNKAQSRLNLALKKSSRWSTSEMPSTRKTWCGLGVEALDWGLGRNRKIYLVVRRFRERWSNTGWLQICKRSSGSTLYWCREAQRLLRTQLSSHWPSNQSRAPTSNRHWHRLIHSAHLLFHSKDDWEVQVRPDCKYAQKTISSILEIWTNLQPVWISTALQDCQNKWIQSH